LKPIALIVTTTNWVPTARLAVALVNAGFKVEAVCPSRHPIHETRAASRVHPYRGLAPLRSLAAAISKANPEILVPGDDLATWHLHNLYRRRNQYSSNPVAFAALIERSLGLPSSFSIVQSRAAFMEFAREQGIRVPTTETLRAAEAVPSALVHTGFPIVLKADGTSGGEGVRIARTSAEARSAFHKLHAPPLLARAFKRALLDQDSTLVSSALLRRGPMVTAQSFIAGHEATSTVACWKGTVLADLHFEVLRKGNAAGHATVVQLIDHPEIANTVEKVVRRLGLSGLCGFDFMLEANTGHAYLIEINPRATQVGHLTLGQGHDLPAALYAAISGRTIRAGRTVTENETIALFPHEWARDSQSEFLRTGYHDVPWETPELVHACMRRSKKQTVWYTRREPVREEIAKPRTAVAAESPAVPVDCDR
jgi:hypothetical protein